MRVYLFCSFAAVINRQGLLSLLQFKFFLDHRGRLVEQFVFKRENWIEVYVCLKQFVFGLKLLRFGRQIVNSNFFRVKN